MTGVMNAADYYGLEELRKSCVGFVQCCINVDTVCALLATAERYIQYKCTKSLVQKVNHSCCSSAADDWLISSFRCWNLSTNTEMKCSIWDRSRCFLNTSSASFYAETNSKQTNLPNFRWNLPVVDLIALRRKWATKFTLAIRQAALMWSKKYCDSNPNINLKEVLSNFLEFIRFHQIPANVLMREIHPIGNLQSSCAINRKCASFSLRKMKM